MPGTPTPKHGLQTLSPADDVNDFPAHFNDVVGDLDTLIASAITSTFATRPAASTFGRLHRSTDTGVISFDTGAAWIELIREGDGRLIPVTGITNAQVAAAAAIAESKLSLASDAAAGTASRRSLGTGATQAAAGNDSRFPAGADIVNTDIASNAAIAESKLSLASDAAAGTASRRSLGTGSTQAAAGSHRAQHEAAGVDQLRVQACGLRKAAVQSIPHNSWTKVLLDTVVHDAVPDTPMATLASNGITIVDSGRYMLAARAAFAPAASGARGVRVIENGSSVREAVLVGGAGGGVQTFLPLCRPFHFGAGDLLTLEVFQDSGGAVNLDFASAWHAPGLEVIWVGQSY